MNAHAPVNVSLIEPDIEATVLGSIINYPDALAAVADDLNANWFADPACRMFLDAALKLHREGHRLTPKVLIAAVTPAVEVDGLTRAQFVAAASAQAMPLSYLSGSLATLRDRWARRALAAEGEAMSLAATALEADPFTVASEAIGVLDNISVTQGEAAVASLYKGNERLFEAMANADHRRSPTTGIASLDELLNGYSAGKLYVVAGRPGMGKSAFACSSLRKTAAAGHGVKLFSLEMGGDEISARCLSDTINDIRGPHFGSLLKNQYAPEWGDPLVAAHESHRALPMSVDASPNLTMSQIASRARKAKAMFEAAGKKLAVVCIDHLGLVAPADRYKGNKVAEVGEISRASKGLAKELDCCVLLLCQLNRGVEGREDKHPSLADLRWSGEIEQDADVVAFLYREHYYLTQKPETSPDELAMARHRLEFLIRKNRNGETRDVRLWCSIAHSSIRDGGPAR